MVLSKKKKKDLSFGPFKIIIQFIIVTSFLWIIIFFFLFFFWSPFSWKLPMPWLDWWVSFLLRQITTYSSMIWSKFKLSICDLKFDTLSTKFKLSNCALKFHNANVPLDYFFILFDLVFLCIFIFLEEREIKVE